MILPAFLAEEQQKCAVTRVVQAWRELRQSATDMCLTAAAAFGKHVRCMPQLFGARGPMSQIVLV